jgi:hypothetical protein
MRDKRDEHMPSFSGDDNLTDTFFLQKDKK